MSKYLLIFFVLSSSFIHFAFSQEEWVLTDDNRKMLASYFEGRNYKAATDYLQQHAEEGSSDAQWILGLIYSCYLEELEQGIYWLEIAANRGHTQAQTLLGSAYFDMEDYEKARGLFETAAVQNDAGAQFHLGLLYDEGCGVKQNYRQAIHWFEKAANQNHDEAQHELGRYHLFGLGVSKNYAIARSYFEKAALQGNPESQFDLGLMYYKAEGVKKDYSQAAYWFQKSAERYNAKAQYTLGLLYKDGIGVAKDLDKAMYWLSSANLNGDEQVKMNAASVLYTIYDKNPHLRNSIRGYGVETMKIGDRLVYTLSKVNHKA